MKSSINHHYTFEYSQPEEYHFSHDSVFLARQIFEKFREIDLSKFQILDLCSGCGIVGLDFLFHIRKENLAPPKQMDFLEIQPIYSEHFKTNTHRLGTIDTHTKFIPQNYKVLREREFSNTYDLIISNPPYFNKSEGTLSTSEFKNRCRFFMDSSLENLIQGIAHSLKPGGQAYILARQDINCPPGLGIELCGEIRGTPLYRIEKA